MTRFVNLSRGLTRRGLLGATGALVLGFHLPGCRGHAPPVDMTIALGPDAAGAHDLNAWLSVSEDGVVTAQVGASEMGQGVYTALPMILAEELDADWSLVRVVSAPAHKAYRRESPEFPVMVQLTGGSESVRGYWNILREAGASARAMLVEAAALRWGVDPSECRAEGGEVICGERRAAYGALAADAALLKPPSKVALKDPADFVLLGTSPARLDLPPKVDGSATFGMDVHVPGAVNATVVACPHYGGHLVRFDAAKAREAPGVIDVFQIEDSEAIAVIADTFWRAKRAAGLLEITWDAGEGAGLDTAAIRAKLQAAMDKGGKTVFHHGGRLGDATITASYEVPYLDHAPIEPLNAAAHVQADRVDVWAPTQGQGPTRYFASKIAGVHKDKVFVHTTFLGGGFGRKGFWDFTDYAVKISKQIGAPVKTTWTREESFTHGYYRPMCLCRQRARLGEDGLPADWYVEMASQNIMDSLGLGAMAGSKAAAVTVVDCMSHAPYHIPNQRVDYARVVLPVEVGWWRSVHGSHNGFFRECFIDELAHEAGWDPIEYRRAMLVENPRFLAVLDLAVEKAGPVPEGQHRGVALIATFGSIVAEVADVTLTGGDLRVHRVTAAIDCGVAVHPDTIRAQVQSGVGMGLSAALYGGLTLEDGAVVEKNFHQYPLMRLDEMPAVDVHIVPSAEPPGGVGEPGLPPIAAAVCNAIFHASGKRIRTLPIADQLKV